MLTRVPRSEGEAGDEFAPISFNLLAFGPEGVSFRFVDDKGRLFDLCLNPVVAKALGACLALAGPLVSDRRD